MTAEQTLILLLFILIYILIGAFIAGVAVSYFGNEDVSAFFFAWPILLVCILFLYVFRLGRNAGGRK